MKRDKLERATKICNDLRSYEEIVRITLEKSCKVEITISADKTGGRNASIPADHSKFLQRVIRDHYQVFIDRLQKELETL